MNRLSLNQRTLGDRSLPEAVSACTRAGVESIGVWRGPLWAFGVERGAKLVAEAGLRVSSLCRGGFFTSTDRRSTLARNRRAVDDAEALGAECLVLVVGGLPSGSRDLPAARATVSEVLAELVDYAQERSVRLALEPMHPMYCADRGVLSTLGQALDLAECFDPDAVGVVVDTFHVWWDPDLERQLARARGRIASFQVGDWITPLSADSLLARGLMGRGHIDFQLLGRLVSEAGYTGDVEVEIFNADLWRQDVDSILAAVVRSYQEHVVA
ncbi:sugar phosphate isomerase/epimerase family protein [Haloechinothrix salitolerans]|uniref:Sugar phosphate isomerase/epimerase family protein n=1 Tax=Haloechinothrix salitolerans TaxID=926830 RepID=A0ABW2BXI5_9PSEU